MSKNRLSAFLILWSIVCLGETPFTSFASSEKWDPLAIWNAVCPNAEPDYGKSLMSALYMDKVKKGRLYPLIDVKKQMKSGDIVIYETDQMQPWQRLRAILAGVPMAPQGGGVAQPLDIALEGYGHVAVYFSDSKGLPRLLESPIRTDLNTQPPPIIGQEETRRFLVLRCDPSQGEEPGKWIEKHQKLGENFCRAMKWVSYDALMQTDITKPGVKGEIQSALKIVENGGTLHDGVIPPHSCAELAATYQVLQGYPMPEGTPMSEILDRAVKFFYFIPIDQREAAIDDVVDLMIETFINEYESLVKGLNRTLPQLERQLSNRTNGLSQQSQVSLAEKIKSLKSERTSHLKSIDNFKKAKSLLKYALKQESGIALSKSRSKDGQWKRLKNELFSEPVLRPKDFLTHLLKQKNCYVASYYPGYIVPHCQLPEENPSNDSSPAPAKLPVTQPSSH